MLSTNIEKYNHLLVGKVRDTQMMFSFIVEASIVDVDQALGGNVSGAAQWAGFPHTQVPYYFHAIW